MSQEYKGDVWLNDWGMPYKQYHVNFEQLERDGYASLAVFGIGIGANGSQGLIDFNLYQNGPSYGSYAYNNQYINHGGQGVGFEGEAQGIYQEIYGVGGVAAYYVNYHLTFNCSYFRPNSASIYCKIKLVRIN